MSEKADHQRCISQKIHLGVKACLKLVRKEIFTVQGFFACCKSSREGKGLFDFDKVKIRLNRVQIPKISDEAR